MKKVLTKCFGILAGISLLASSGISTVYAETDNFTLSQTKTVITLNETGNFVEGSYGSDSIADLDGVTYTSSDESVLEIDEYGEILERNYGAATVTAQYNGKTASVLITVTPYVWINRGFDDEETEIARSGTGARAVAGKTVEFQGQQDYNVDVLTWQSYNGEGKGRYRALNEAWFYDNGQSESAEAGVLFRTYLAYRSTGAVGILQSSDTTYKVSNVIPYVPGNGAFRLTKDHITNPKLDTGIQRSKGWHQVSTIVVDDAVKIYLDGQQVDSIEQGSGQFGIIGAYSGANSAHTAYFDDVVMAEYVSFDEVTISAAENNTFAAAYKYTGPNDGFPSPQYQWYYADSPDGAWTEIAGASSASYSLTGEIAGKWIRAGVKISDSVNGNTFLTNEVFSAPVATFNGVYQSISLAANDTIYDKGAAAEPLEIIGIDENGVEQVISDLSDITFVSNRPEIVSVDQAGQLTFCNYGVAKITATKDELAASMLITVTPQNYYNPPTNIVDGNKVPYGETVTFQGGYESDQERIKLKNMLWLNWRDGQTALSGRGFENSMLEAWFYDNGKDTDSEAGIQFCGYQSNSGTGVIGVLRGTDTTYRISGIQLRNPITANIDLFDSHLENAEDTGIQRTAGWHQVSLLDIKRANGQNQHELYLDGKLIKTYSDWGTWPGIINMFAGTDVNHTAQFKKPMFAEYHTLSEVSVTADGTGRLCAEYIYNGNVPTAVYQWYSADSADSLEWTRIEGANTNIYEEADPTKFYRVSVQITDTVASRSPQIPEVSFTTAEVYSEPFKAAQTTETSISYADGVAVISASEAIRDGILLVVSYEQTGGYTKLVSAESYTVNCQAHAAEIVPVGTLEPGQVLMLWDGMQTMRPLCAAQTVAE